MERKNNNRTLLYEIEKDKVSIDEKYLKKYKNFFQVKNWKIIVNNRLKEKISFYRWDILTKKWLINKKYDVIVFQNLVSHFQDEPGKIKIMIKNLENLLKNDE